MSFSLRFARALAEHCDRLLWAGWEVRIAAETWDWDFESDTDVMRDARHIERYILSDGRILFADRWYQPMYDPNVVNDNGWLRHISEAVRGNPLEESLELYACEQQTRTKVLSVTAHRQDVEVDVFRTENRILNAGLAFCRTVEAWQKFSAFKHRCESMNTFPIVPRIASLQDECLLVGLHDGRLHETCAALLKHHVFDSTHQSIWHPVYRQSVGFIV